MKKTPLNKTAGWSFPVNLILPLLAFLFYANTLGHGFVLDDSVVLTKNKFTTAGIAGWSDIATSDSFLGYYQENGKETTVTGGRYRPLSMLVFALFYQFFGANAFVYHLFNVFIYALTAFVLFKTLHRLFHFGKEERIFSVAFIASLIFVTHPVHTEVVANIKCADETISLLLSLLALNLTIKDIDTGEKKWRWWAGLSFAGACFAKENAITFLAVIPLAIYFFRLRSPARPMAQYIQLLAPSALSAIFFILIRGWVFNWNFGEESQLLMNNPFLKWDGAKWQPFNLAERSAAIVLSLGEYLRLLIFPHPLTHDYYPRQIGIVNWGDWRVLLSAFSGAVMIYFAIAGFWKKSIPAFAILFYIATISIVSNVFFPIGTNLSERFIFMPSIGFGILLAYLLTIWSPPYISYLLLAILVTGYAFKTISRNTVWKDNLTLASTDIKTSLNSAKIHNSLGSQLCQKALEGKSIQEQQNLTAQAIALFNRALEINPNYIEAYFGRGSAHFIRREYEEALKDYLSAEKIDPLYPDLQNNLVLALRESAKSQMAGKGLNAVAIQYLQEAQRRYPNDPEINSLLKGIHQN